MERFAVPLQTGDSCGAAVERLRFTCIARKAVDVAFEHPDQFNPAFLEEMRKDADLFDALLPIRLAIGTLHQKLDDTVMQVGAEGYAAARSVYSATKTSF